MNKTIIILLVVLILLFLALGIVTSRMLLHSDEHQVMKLYKRLIKSGQTQLTDGEWTAQREADGSVIIKKNQEVKEQEQKDGET